MNISNLLIAWSKTQKGKEEKRRPLGIEGFLRYLQRSSQTTDFEFVMDPLSVT